MDPTLTASTPQVPEYQREKLEAAILFFLKGANNGHLGKTKLMKMLYYADFDHMERHGSPITGARYVKMPQGPVPRKAFAVLDEMELSRKIISEKREVGRYTQTKYEPLVEPSLSTLDSDELRTLKRVALQWADEPLSRIVSATHGESPWLSVGMGEVIPYDLARFRSALNMNF